MGDIRDTVNNVDSPVRDYLNPKSAITMGACAAMVLAFTTTLCGAFPFLPAAIVALALSVGFGWAQVAYLAEKLGMKIFYAAVCSLIIFNAARGGNLAITDVNGTTVTVAPAVLTVSTNKVSMMDVITSIDFVQTAYAGDKASKDGDKFYFFKEDNGNLIYTNINGKTHIVPKKGTKVKAWTWK